MSVPPKLNPVPVAPTTPTIPMVDGSGTVTTPKFPSQYTQPQAAPPAPVQGEAIRPALPKVTR